MGIAAEVIQPMPAGGWHDEEEKPAEVHDAFPVRWTGPSFDANGAAVFGTETLEIAHSGLVLPA